MQQPDVLKKSITDAGKCPRCNNKLLFDNREDDGQIMKGIVKVIDGKLYSLCKGCKSFVNIPLEMLKGFQVPVKFSGKKYRMTIK